MHWKASKGINRHKMSSRQFKHERLLTPRETADYLRLNPRTVTRLAREGKLPGVKVGKRWRFRREELAGWSLVRSGDGAESEFEAAPSTASAISITSLLRPDLVIPDLKAVDKPGALCEIVSHLVDVGVLREGQLFLRLLMEREDLMSTNIAEGVAVPHPRRAVGGMFEESFIAVAISRRGVDFAGSSGVGVRVFFLICANDDRSHLRILARISRLLRETPVVERMLEARLGEEIIGVVAVCEEALHEDAGLIAG
ncbi:MAG: PTS sugar transporter subunit IIA [Planctomycetes bacterium]|nr:PTS sugar transporter subunit IIA [Planctomycetota bacterium]